MYLVFIAMLALNISKEVLATEIRDVGPYDIISVHGRLYFVLD